MQQHFFSRAMLNAARTDLSRGVSSLLLFFFSAAFFSLRSNYRLVGQPLSLRQKDKGGKGNGKIGEMWASGNGLEWQGKKKRSPS